MTAPAANESAQDGNNPSGATSAAGDEFKPITSQDDLNRIISERVNREKAKYADYRDLKAKAERLDQIEEANKTEAQKSAERLATVEREAATARAEALRLRIATKHGISDEDADLFLTGTDEATLTRQAERLAQRAADRKKQGNTVPREGGNPNPGASTGDLREFTRQLFRPAAAD